MLLNGWLRDLSSRVELVRQARLKRRQRRCSHAEVLEDRTLLTFVVESTNPSVTDSILPTGTDDLVIQLSDDADATSGTTPFELRSVGPDGLLGNIDDEVIPITSATYSGADVTLQFAELPESVYRLTIFDSLLDDSGEALDGNSDGSAGGDYQSDFVVTEGSSANQVDLVSRIPEEFASDTGNDASFNPSISGDGRFVAFRS
ncbi:MAG: hypothetical protein AB8G99_06505, partial [Planctomycetaceae bacterium]